MRKIGNYIVGVAIFVITERNMFVFLRFNRSFKLVGMVVSEDIMLESSF